MRNILLAIFLVFMPFVARAGGDSVSQDSIFWPTSGIGDGVATGYTSDQWTWAMRMMWLNDPTTQGVSLGYLNDLEVTNPAGVTLRIATGGAIVYGIPYRNTANVDFALTIPVIGTTGWRLVLQADWAAQTVRLVLLQNVDGGLAWPAVTQTAGVRWEISLAVGTITTVPVVAVTDDRSYLDPGILIDDNHIVSREMNTLVQAVSAEVAGVLVVRDAEGWKCAAGVETDVWGNFRIPEDADLTQAFYATPVYYVESTTATNVDIDGVSFLGAIGQVFNSHFRVGASIEPSGAAWVLQSPVAQRLDLHTVADNNDFATLQFTRNGHLGTDTYAGSLFFVGWLLTYIRDH